MTWRSTKGKSGLIRQLINKGFSARKAEKAVNAVFDVLSTAIASGQIVELPGGSVQAIATKAKPRQELHWFTHGGSGKRFYRFVQYGHRKVIYFRPDPALQLDLLVPPAAETAAMAPKQPLEQAVELATALLRAKPSEQQLAQLLAAALGDPAILLLRLRAIQQRGRLPYCPLDQDVASLYWFR